MVYVHLANGFEEIEAITVVDVLRRAGIVVKTISMSQNKTVIGTHEISVLTDLLFEESDYNECEMIVLPGGMPGTSNLANHEGLINQIHEFADNGKWIGAICAAPMILGDNSILKGRHATIFPGMEEHLVGAKYSDEKVVVDGNIITSKGAGTAMEFALKLASLLAGEQKADSLRKAMVV